jgi:hypothetical protein
VVVFVQELGEVVHEDAEESADSSVHTSRRVRHFAKLEEWFGESQKPHETLVVIGPRAFDVFKEEQRHE